MMHGWQGEPIDGPKRGCDFQSGCNGHLTHNYRMQCGVAKCNVIAVVMVVAVVLVEQLSLQLQCS